MRFLLLVCCVSTINCAKILTILTLPTFNHFNLIYRIVKELVNQNHEVTFISPFPYNHSGKNYEHIFVENPYKQMKKVQLDLVDLKNKGTIGRTYYDFTLGVKFTEDLLSDKKVQKLLNSTRQFDLVIIAQYFNEAAIGIGYHFNAPVIIFTPLRLSFRSNHLVGAPAPSSYVRDAFSVQTELNTFWDRLNNFITNNLLELLRATVYLPEQKKLFEKYVNNKIDFNEVMYNVSLVLSNYHCTVYDAAPQLPSVVNIGGFHVEKPTKLPEHLQNYLDNAKNGVILFSMGSGFQSKNLDLKVRTMFLNVFAKLKQNVIWKFESELKNRPKNLKTFKWLPQQDVLGHPNVRAFITHGGISSMIESVYFGVPVVGIPSFADQESNLATAVSRGFAVSVPIKDITEKNLLKALEEVLNEPKYKENALKMSKLMHDQPMKPIDSAVYWIEYVIRHQGAPHFRSPGLDLKWYQRDMVDIITFLVLSFVTIVILFRKICKKRKVTEVTDYKKNK